ncbi:L,D-transpeptidase family protein [uncultured Sphingomonas sp.]|uniref:L,D-transpeptidase family protein n=1 Tax=uncultured Sphingomonas sp. TaxID=158754 RepID=UPI0025F8294E|nr:L,D-transpeptidase family protein [uncultured Sphingomonas sp.]
MQVVLDRIGFGPGIIDGHRGASLTKAVKGFQSANDLRVTGELDSATLVALRPYASTPGVVGVPLSRWALAGPFVGAMPDKPEDQAKLPVMGYADVMEKLAERFHTSKATLIALNSPSTRLRVGAVIRVPNVLPSATSYPDTLRPDWRDTLKMLSVSSAQPRAERVVVDKSDGVLRVFGEGDKLIAQFPATMGSVHDPLPIGKWTIQGTAYLPPFHYNPDLFWDADKGDTKQQLKPGPNGPVGVVWMDLNKPHYGIHGTSHPESIGRSESHGCIRLSNWDAARLSLMVRPGTPAVFQP